MFTHKIFCLVVEINYFKIAIPNLDYGLHIPSLLSFFFESFYVQNANNTEIVFSASAVKTFTRLFLFKLKKVKRPN
jgi:hypothetical protein